MYSMWEAYSAKLRIARGVLERRVCAGVNMYKSTELDCVNDVALGYQALKG